MKKPMIALTPQYEPGDTKIWMRPQYGTAIMKSGGVPILLEMFDNPDVIESYCDTFDGILFTGGGDVHPKYYGEEVMPECGPTAEARDLFELALYREAVKRDMPVFGICRGIQFMNVAAGGTLIQHIPSHMGTEHDVEIKRDSLFYDILGKDTIHVNSWHHQAVKAPAPNMTACAWSDVEGVGRLIEAIWNPSARFNASVQWHPENMYAEYDEENSAKLFDAFVSACADYAVHK